MLRRAVAAVPRAGVRHASSSAAAGPSAGSRRVLYYSAGGLALATAAAALTMGTAHADEREVRQGVKGDVRPHPLWSPPTRAQMIAALKASSAASLRPDAARVSEDNQSLAAPAKDAKGSTPSPAARADSGGEAVGRDGNEDGEGFDLLIVGGGATGAGVAVDATTRGLSVAMVERDDFGAGAWRPCESERCEPC